MYYYMVCKKRKRDIYTELKIEKIVSLPCECCGIQVENYKNCINHIVYCSFDCLSVILLRKMNDQKTRNFDDIGDPDEIMLYDE